MFSLVEAMFVKSVFLLAIVLKASEGRLEPLPDELTERLSMADCIVSCCLKFFTGEDMITISLSPEEVNDDQPSAIVSDRILLPRLSRVGKWSLLVTKSSSRNTHLFKQTGSYIIHIRTANELKSHIENLKKYHSWNPHAKVMVVSTEVFNNASGIVGAIVETLWSAKVVDGIIMLHDSLDPSYYSVYSWFPYSAGNCGSNFYKIKNLDNCTFGYFDQNVNLFPNKIPKKLNDCPVRVRVIQWPPYVMPPKEHIAGTEIYEFDDGLEINLINTIAEQANFKIIYSMSNTTQNFGNVDSNGTTTGIFSALREEKTDIALGSLALSEEGGEKFDFSTTYHTESLTWCVPHAKSQPSIEKLTNTLKTETWVVLVVAYMFFSILVWGLSKLEKREFGTYKRLPNVMQTTLSVILGMAVKTLPKTTIVRTFLFLWILSSLVMDIYYTTFMISTLTGSSYMGQINTLNEILENKLKLYLMPNTIQYFNGTTWQMKQILKEWKNCSHIHDCLTRVAFQRDSAVCIPRLYMEYVYNRYVDADKQPLLYYFKESVVSYPIAMYMTRGYPLKQRINELISRIISAGLITTWEQKVFDYKWKNASVLAEESSEEPENKWLTIDHLEAVLFSLAIGHSFALVVFIAEIVVYKRKKDKIEFCH